MFFKRKYIILLFIIVLISGLVSSFTLNNKSIKSSEKDKVILQLVSYILQKWHFDKRDINDDFSEKVYYSYLESMDGQKRFFLQNDITSLSPYRYLLDDEIDELNTNFFDVSYKKFQVRFEQVRGFYKDLLKTPFDFSKEESINVDYEKIEYVKSISELENRWRKNLKFSALAIYTDKIKVEKVKKKQDSTYAMKSFEVLEKEARDKVLENMNIYFEYMDDLDEKDWFSIYINTISSQFDPHTFYFAPQEKEVFDTSMSGQYEGIGARLQKKNQEIKIIELLSGGPVWKDKLLEVGDIILKVSQKDKETIEVTGMRLDDVVKFIKGPKNTKVTLTVKRVDGTIEDITITRGVVELEETYAKSTIIKKGDTKIGFIDLPKFYIDFKKAEEINASSDVKREIEELKKQNIEGLIIDLRSNGGGSLKTVVDMTGLFIKEGPVVQVKSIGQEKEVLYDTDDSITWDGPLVILVSENSASASEILAGALQDYKRAVIIGGEQTYGKGTVQNVIELDNMMKKNTYGKLGAIKITTDKFYRINGSSTQLKGIKSDISYPTPYTYIALGERDQENPLAWDTISETDYSVWENPIDYDYILTKSKNRISNDSIFSLIDEQAKWIKQQQDKMIYSLNYNSYNDELKTNELYVERFDFWDNYKTSFDLEYTTKDKEKIAVDEKLKSKRKRWHQSLKSDIYLDESVNVINDLISNK